MTKVMMLLELVMKAPKCPSRADYPSSENIITKFTESSSKADMASATDRLKIQ